MPITKRYHYIVSHHDLVYIGDTNMTMPLDADVANFNKRVGQYVKLRDLIREKEKQHKEQLAPFKDTLEKLGSVMLHHLNTIGAERVGTENGTVHKTTKKSASIADMTAFWTWVVTQGAFDMVDKKANVIAVEEYIQEQIELAKTDPTIIPSAPPGVNFTQFDVVGVKRS